jgi:ribA/ribD-fused uncharacterized protein
MEPIRQFRGQHMFLSNFASMPKGIEYQGILYPTAEHAFQASKTTDVDKRRHIAMLPSPGLAKTIGKGLELRREWSDEMFRLRTMCEILRIKFAQEPFKTQLLATGDAELQEGNYWHDNFYGIDLQTGQGKNHLGRLLMKVRKELHE